MENRFGIKDFFLFSLVAVLIIVMLFAMKQYDRQYQIVRDIDQQGRDQLRELVAIHSALDRGIAMGPTTRQSNQGPDPFANLRNLRDAGKYNQGDWLVQNLAAPVGKITPIIGGDLYAVMIQSHVQECLAYLDVDTLKWIPLLATGWQVSADGLTITFQLRKGVTFSDGTPFNADDVVFTYNWIEDPKVDAPRERQGLERVASVTKTNDFEVVFKFREPYYQSFAAVATLNVLSKAFYEKYSEDQFNQSVGLLIGTGPYQLRSPTDWKPNPGKIELIRNERYWGLQSSFDRLVFYQLESDTTNLVMFTNGDLDAIGLPPQQYQLLLKRPEVVGRTNHYEYVSPLSGYSYIGWNEQRNGKPTIFADKRVRQALTMLTNRQGICKDIYLGYASPAKGPFSPLSNQSDPALQDWKYDPERAKALLKEAGFDWRDDSGVLKKTNGTPLSFKLTFGSKNETVEREMQYVKDSYARAGVHAELDPADWTIMSQRTKTRDFDAMCAGWAAGSLEDDLYQIFDSSQIADQGDNFISYSDLEFDATLKQARITIDESRRMELWHKCERLLHEDQPYTFLINSKSLRFLDKRIQNVHPAHTGLNWVQDWVMPIPWYVPTAMQKYTK